MKRPQSRPARRGIGLHRRALLPIPAILAAAAGSGCAWLEQNDGTPWQDAPQLDIVLSSTGVVPQHIRLRRGAPVQLRVVNADTQGRAFIAPGFFANVATRPGEALFTSAGGIDLPPGTTRRLIVMPLVAGQWTVDTRADIPPGAASTITVLPSPG